ncbi:MAG: helix-turn-helix domain-containing protein [Deltaproteobacteria bacterium]|nr:helix-turn-helix domain-containing protein [Deltaproteobacteria bacterium]
MALRLLTVTDAAALLQVSKRTILRLIHHSEIPAFRVGGQWRLRETEFLKWIENRERSKYQTPKPRLTEQN